MNDTRKQRFDRNEMKLAPVLLCLVMNLLLVGCEKKADVTPTQPLSSIEMSQRSDGAVVAKTKSAAFEILPSNYIRASLLDPQKSLALDVPEAETGESVTVGGKEVSDWVLDLASVKISDASGRFGAAGKRIELQSRSAASGLERTFTVEVFDDFPAMAFSTASYRNTKTERVAIEEIRSQRHRLSAALAEPASEPYKMWSFHGSSEAWGKDDVVAISEKFTRTNSMQTMMHNDENRTGGGIPVVAFWTSALGLAIGNVELLPIPLSMPVRVTPDKSVDASIVMNVRKPMAPGEIISTPLSFVAVYKDDFYEPLRLYSSAMQKQGWSLAKPTDADYQANWCGWGYEMDFTPRQMLGTIPKLKEIGIRWATLDAGWFNNRGDWEPRPETFPGDSLQKVVDAYHDAGIHLTLWWLPIAVEDGQGKDILNHKSYALSKVARDHPEWLILDKDGKHARVTADLAALCPAVPEVQAYYKQLAEKFIRDWKFDGHKLDFSYTVPPCYNPAHHHKSPTESTQAVGEIYKVIFQTTRALKPESVTQSCPCGTPPNMAWLPFIDQAVTADPVGSRQVRLRTKMYKALLGPTSAVYGDHVELTKVLGANTGHESDVGQDFASSIGTGAVLGTKFTWPDYGPKFKAVYLNPQKELYWKKWIGIYNAKMLSRGNFQNLYAYGVDLPEGYAIEKDGRMYYAFFAASARDSWKGTLELRGLAPGHYSVFDYEHEKSLGIVDAVDPKLPNVEFTDHLLLEVNKN